MSEEYKVPQGKEIEFKGVWYRQGDIMPKEYKPPVKKVEKVKKEGK